MSRQDELAAAFLAARPRLIRIGYAVLGSRAEAEDVVSDCWLRLARADAGEPIADVEAWLTVVVARAALDAYRSARIRRERYVGPWLPEPELTDNPVPTPEDRATLDDTVSFALLVVLESLSPAERTTWVLHELFGLPFTEIAGIVGRTPAAVRQLAVRARDHLRRHQPRLEVDVAVHDRAVSSFLRAASGGGLGELLRVLDPAVVLTSDGGGEVSAARRPVFGADKVARFLAGVADKYGAGQELRPRLVNGRQGLAIFADGVLDGVIAFAVTEAGRIARIDFIRAPSKLARSGHGAG